MWVNVPTSKFCGGEDRNCYSAGTFNLTASRTQKLVNHDFEIHYVDTRGGSGDYVTDDLHFAGQELKDVQFGLGLVSSSRRGFIGIGYPIREAYVVNKGGSPFSNLPQILKNEGLINSMAYSLWLNDREASQGSLLFGGVDVAKFHGNLTTLQIEKNHGQFEQFFVNLTDLRFTNATDSSQFAIGKSTLPLPVLLDSGSTLMTLPEDIVNEVFSTLKILKHNDKMPVFDCGLGQENSTLDFTFATAKISVPMSELVLPIYPDQDLDVITTDDDIPLCRLGITYDTPTGPLILGDTFLRSAFVVYDMTNNEISIAPTNFNAVDSNIVEIDNGDGSDILNLAGTAETSNTHPSSAATPPPISSGTTTANSDDTSSDDTSSAIHFSWSRFAALGGIFAAIASA